MKVVVVSGLSGAGKTVALKEYEDLGYYCIDNLPLEMLGAVSVQALKSDRYRHLAVGVDARESPQEIAKFPGHLEALKQRGVDVHVLFLNAQDDVILRRYGETRRKHPLTTAERTLAEAVQHERLLLKPIADLSDLTLDTSALNLYELREAIRARLPEGQSGRLSLVLMSFGFKNGVPDGTDFVFDVRCLPNPHWVPSLRAMEGRDPEVAAFLQKEPEVAKMTADLHQFLDQWLPRFEQQNRAYVTVAVGCTGGRHRSVYIVERLAEALAGRFETMTVKHKELA